MPTCGHVDPANRASRCAFRPKPATQSGGIQPPNPEESGHLFRLIPAIRSVEAATILRLMVRAVHVPYVIEQDEDGVWCAHAQLRPGVGAHGEGETPEAAVADLREGLIGLVAEFGAPAELTLTIDVA